MAMHAVERLCTQATLHLQNGAHSCQEAQPSMQLVLLARVPSPNKDLQFVKFSPPVLFRTDGSATALMPVLQYCANVQPWLMSES